MDTTRRNFLRSAAALPAVAAVSANPAMAASVTGALNTAAGASRMSGIMAALGEIGGLSHSVLQCIASMSNNYKREPAGGIVTTLMPDAAADNAFAMCDAFYDIYEAIPMGRVVDFHKEQEVFYLLRSFPPDIPLLDLLQNDVYEKMREGFLRHTTKGELHFLCTAESFNNVREFFKPYCTETTTAQDLMNKLQSYFIRLAEHACENSHEFYHSSSYHTRGCPEKADDLHSHSALRNIQEVLKNFWEQTPETQELQARVSKAAEAHEEASKALSLPHMQRGWHRLEEHNRKNREEQIAQRLKQFMEQADKPARRHPCMVILRPIEAGRFSIFYEHDTPTRMDWLHWLQSIDPENARPADIEVDYRGGAITIKNTEVLTYLSKLQRSQNKPTFHIVLPNRRMGVDLNMPREMAPAPL